MKKTVWKFGLISGGIISAMMLLATPFEAQIGPDRGEIIGYTTMIAAFLLIFFGIRSYRDNVGHGRISFGRAMTVGVLIAAIASVCYTATWEVVYFGLRPDYVEKMNRAQIDKVKASGGSQAEIDKRIADVQRFTRLYQNPAINAAITFVEPFPVAVVIALVSAGILSRKRRADGAEVAAVA